MKPFGYILLVSFCFIAGIAATVLYLRYIDNKPVVFTTQTYEGGDLPTSSFKGSPFK